MQWADPALLASAAIQRSGQEFLRAIIDGELPQPPIAYLLHSRITGVTPGSATFICHPDESMYNPIGTIHGGVVCTLLDSVLGCAVHSTLPAGYSYTSIDTNVQFLRPVYPDSGPLTATGRVIKSGRRVGFAEGEVINSSGAAVARGYGSLLIIAPESATG